MNDLSPWAQHVRFGLLSRPELQHARRLFSAYPTIVRRIDRVLTAQFEERAAADAAAAAAAAANVAATAQASA